MAGSSAAGVLHYIRSLVGVPAAADWTDQALLRRFAGQHDEAALVTLLQRHGPLVLGVCRQVLSDPAAAEDAFQATFLVLARKAADLHCGDSLAPWLHRVAVRIALKARTASARRERHEQGAYAMKDDAVLPGAPADWLPLVHEEIDRLPMKYRESVVRCYLQGQSHTEAAEALHWPVGTVKGRLDRARDLLRDRLARRGLALSAAGVSAALAQTAMAATVPAALEQLTLRTVAAWSTGALTAGGVSGRAVVFAEGMLAALRCSPWQRGGLVLLLTASVTLGAGYASYRAFQVQPIAAPAPAANPPPAADPNDDLRAKLALAIDLDKGIDPNTPLKDALDFLADRYALKIVIDEKSFEDDGIQKVSEQPVILPRMMGVRLSTVLRLLLGQLKGDRCTGRYRLKDGKLEITAALESALVQGQRLPPWDSPPPAQDRSLEAQLNRTIHLEQGIDQNTPLKDALEFLAEETGITVLIDAQSFATLGIHKIEHQPVELAPANNLKLVTVLARLLHCIRAAENMPIAVRLCTLLEGERPACCLEAVTGHAAPLAFSPDGKLLAVPHGRGLGLRIWDVPGNRVRATPWPESWLASVSFAPDGKSLLTVGLHPDNAGLSECTVARWDSHGVQVGEGWKRPNVRCAVLSPDGQALVVSDAQGLHLLDAATGKPLHKADGVTGSIAMLAYAGDGRSVLALGGDPATPTVWRWEPTREARPVRLVLDAKAGGDGLPVHTIVPSPDGQLLATIDLLNRVSLWELASGQRLPHFRVSQAVAAAFTPDRKLLAVTTPTGEQALWEVRTGRQVARLQAAREELGPLAFAPDGKTLAAVSEGSTAVLWDITDLRPGQPAVNPLTDRQLETLWQNLASDNAEQGWQAQLQLTAAENATPFLQARLRPVTAADQARIHALVANLDHERFAARQQAAADLRTLGRLAEPALRRVLKNRPSIEVQHRIEDLLHTLDGPVRAPEQLRALRALEVLEQTGTAAARQLVQTLAEGEPEGWLTQEAQATLKRLPATAGRGR